MEKLVGKRIVFLICLAFVLVGCGQVEEVKGSIEEVVETQLDEMKVEISDIVKEAVSEAVQSEMEVITGEATNFVESVEERVGLSEFVEVEIEDEELVEVVIFYPDSQVEFFIEESVYTQKTGDWVEEALQALIEHGIIPSDVTITEYVLEQECLVIGLSQEFEEFMNQFGTSGEYMHMGSVVNTLLVVGGLEMVEIHIGNRYLETGHAIYDVPLRWYEDSGEME